MKSPYLHMNARNIERLDLILLDGLSHCKAPATTDAVIQIADPRGFAQLDLERVIHELTLMIAEGYVERSGSPAFHDKLAWQITEKGRAHLIAGETRSVIEEVARHTPIRTTQQVEKPRIEEVPEADLAARLRASHKQLDRDGLPPAKPKAVATVCIDDAELDDWWSSLNVQAKAEIFCEHSLVGGEAADVRIPIAGSIAQAVETRVTDPFQIAAEKPYECQTGGD